MENTNWLRQAPGKPLFPDLLWSRPENKRTAGKLLVIGGNSHAFSAVSEAYSAAQDAGAGTVRIVLPASLEKALGRMFPEAEFVPATPSGSFAKSTLAALCDGAAWSDSVLLAGDFGKNSETAILLENFISKYKGPLTLADDSVDYFISSPDNILDRADTTLVVSLSQLQKLLTKRVLIKHSMDLAQLVKALESLEISANLVTVHSGQILAAKGGRVVSTPSDQDELVKLAAYAATWTLQHPNQVFEALACAVYCFASSQVKKL